MIVDHLCVLASFSTSMGAHVGIGTLPLVWFGTEEQKRRYLPKLASCEWIAAYALSEASSGSDAMNIRTRATLSPDGRTYILNGEKHWITNCAIAGLYTVFAKIDGEKFSAFLIERNTPGLTSAPRNTNSAFAAPRPALWCSRTAKCRRRICSAKPGKGHLIAFNVLNIGRLKLGAACVGGARNVLGHMIRYAKERRAFGKPIAEMGLIQRKISASAARLYAAESMAYRTAGMIDAKLGVHERNRQTDASHQAAPSEGRYSRAHRRICRRVLHCQGVRLRNALVSGR